MKILFSSASAKSAPEARKKIARGETVGLNARKNSSSGRSGRNLAGQCFFRPVRGLIYFGHFTHDFIVGYFRTPLRGFTIAATILFVTSSALAETMNNLSEAEIQGRNLARQLCEMRPAENSTNNGILEIQNSKGKTVEIPIGFRVTITNTNWQSLYNMHKIFGSNKNRSGWTSLKVTHKDNNPNQYRFYEFFLNIQIDPVITNLTSEQTMVPFANSDFWICDLGLEFFHWPEQKILPNPTNLKRGRSYTLLESTNPNPSTDGYSRVLSYIDKETGGILEAEAYDSRGKLLKEFYPKDVKKVDGQWQLQSMEMDNVQTGSRSWIKFDVKKQ